MANHTSSVFGTCSSKSLLALAYLAIQACAGAQDAPRPPAVPLIAHDPYFSVWSVSNQLTGGVTLHWTGAEQALTSLVRVDGKPYRLMGEKPTDLPVLPQVDLRVWPTQTVYTFRTSSVEVLLTFTSPLLPDDLEVFSRPATYVTWQARSLDGRPHETKVYFDVSGSLAVNQPNQVVVSSRLAAANLNALQLGTVDQPVLGKSGDDLRIDWGHLIVATPQTKSTSAIVTSASGTSEFVRSGSLPRGDLQTKAAAESGISTAFTMDLGKVGKAPSTCHAVVAYDDEFSIQYFDQNLRPYWRRNGATTVDLIRNAERDYTKLIAKCIAFDNELTSDLTKAGGTAYSYLGSLAYRQCFAAQKVVADRKGQPLMFSKENFSNGCIATVDVLYPAGPAMLLFSPTLTKASLVPVLEYASSARWKFPFAPHDLGTYPLANGQVYGGGERTEDDQMPVEESGNILLLLGALAKSEGNADFAGKYWPQLSKWANYLADKGFDPESQLSTDDFAGHLAHNVNLSAKAIEALGAYAYLADLRGLHVEAAKYRTLAQSFANRWVIEAAEGDHYKLAFNKTNTWSQKYNLVWDRVIGLNLFPAKVFRTEMDFYRKNLNAYGLPLDSRRDYTKLDWCVWTGTLTGDRSDFEALVNPIVKFLNDTPDRVPMSDWYRTTVARKEGFQARSVVGGVFVKMLDSEAVWKKYASRDRVKAGGWASIPKPPVVTEVVTSAQTQKTTWQYTTQQPAANWYMPAFGATDWQTGTAGFGTEGTPGAVVRTRWDSSDIWIRRTFDLPKVDVKALRLWIHHDEDADVYINGVLATRLGGFSAKYEVKEISSAAKATLKPTGNTLAIHCHQTTGGQYIDAGFATVKSQD